jgi:hypothetical protein
MAPLIESAHMELVELRTQRRQLDEEIGRKEMSLPHLETPAGEYLARNLLASAEAARERLSKRGGS